MVIVYAPYKTRPPRKDIKVSGTAILTTSNIDDSTFSRNVVIEYEYVKKVASIVLPFFIILTAASFVEHDIRIPPLLITEYPLTAPVSLATISISEVLSSSWAALFFVISGVLLRMLFWLGRKEFRYYFARGCAEISQSEYGVKLTRVKQIRYMMLALDSYNKYLKRYLGIQINDKVYSKVALKFLTDKDELKSISSSFKDNDELHPAEYLSDSQKISLPPEEQFLVKGKESVRQIIIEWGAVAAVVIPLLVTVIKEFALTANK
jgi:sporulation protein YlmC with PRC-barrel domain